MLALAGTNTPAFASTQAIASTFHALSLAPPEARSAWRWRLARLYAAHGLYREADGVLTVLASEDPERGAAHDVRIAHATALLETGHDRAALARIDGPAFDGLSQACAVRTRALSRLGQHRKALAQPACGTAASDMARLRSAVLLNDRTQAVAALKRLPDVTTGIRASETEYWRGRLAQLSGDIDLARRHYERAARGAHPAAALLAEIRRVDMDHSAGLIAAGTARARLEALRHDWRGGAAEALLLARIARLSLEVNDVAAAISALSQLAAHGEGDARMKAKASARALYAKLLQSGTETSPAERFAIFWEGRNLLPTGPDGDRMVNILVSDLEAAGHLRQAANLLGHQAEYRLEGAARVEAVKHIASLHIRLGNPADAVTVLRTLPESVRGPDVKRREAAALTAMKRYLEAEARLADDDSSAAQRIRADIAWGRRDWTGFVALAGGALAGEPSRANDIHLLRLAIAARLSGNRAVSAQLARRAAATFERPAYARAFAVLADIISRARSRRHAGRGPHGERPARPCSGGFRFQKILKVDPQTVDMCLYARPVIRQEYPALFVNQPVARARDDEEAQPPPRLHQTRDLQFLIGL